MIFHKRGIAQATNKKTQLPVKPAGLGDASLDIPADEDPRLRLADWMSDKANPYFAKSLVNRYWKHFFKRGLIEPEDDIRDTNPPSNPELLDALARHFVASGYDLKAVIRTDHPVAHLSTQRHAERAQRSRSAEFLAVLSQATERRGAAGRRRPACRARTPISPKCRRARTPSRCPTTATTKGSYFLTVFGRPEGASVCECERSPDLEPRPKLVSDERPGHQAEAGRQRRPRRAAGQGHAAGRGKDRRALSGRLLAAAQRPTSCNRPPLIWPRPRWHKRKPPMPRRPSDKRYEDLLWAIINTKEFLYNH